MRVIGVIPTRLDSKRFPGKALALLHGKPLIQHVYESARKSLILDELVIATDDKKIYNAAVGFGAPVVITPREYHCGTDRVAHAVSALSCEIVVNIQGDQPLLAPETIDSVVKKLLGLNGLPAATPIYPINDREDLIDPNVVKVVRDSYGYALYFSRSPIPYIRGRLDDISLTYKHIGIYAYRKDFLCEFAKLPPSLLEITEGLEQLRILENGYKIMTVQSIFDSPSVDSEEDLRKLQEMIGNSK
jgi:3-deoxy-manno-octulosonate cytidylyltransferase (CMP-KDO synthetase)